LPEGTIHTVFYLYSPEGATCLSAVSTENRKFFPPPVI